MDLFPILQTVTHIEKIIYIEWLIIVTYTVCNVKISSFWFLVYNEAPYYLLLSQTS